MTKIGFIGQGWIGKHYADDFEARGHSVTRYALEEPYVQNKEAIKICTIVFVAVPTPTTEHGFDLSYVEDALTCVGEKATVVIKSTMVPGKTEELQKKNPKLFIFHSPEFLVEKSAAYDAAHPNRNIVGIPVDNVEFRKKAREVLDVLPDSPYERIMLARDAELVKYAGNCFLYTKVMYMNLLYDLVEKTGGDWKNVREALIHDPRVGISHTQPVHDGGRGAGGHCFIKDFEAFRETYDEVVNDSFGSAVLKAQTEKNIELLLQSDKDLDLLEGVYGKEHIAHVKKQIDASA
ncbi:MAG: nucleotide sugar dehydrogenase [Candidatus Azotimanducaceae bacterium]|jgi:nucleotide sugar dehydrogenase